MTAPHPRTGEEGFSLVELMVAIVVFGLLAAAALTTLNYAVGTTRSDRNRVGAANLAARELEIVRDQFVNPNLGPNSITLNTVVNPDPLPGGTPGAPLVLDNVAYTVTRTAQWTSVGPSAPASPCDNGSSAELSSLKVSVTVTWPGMGTIPAVRSDTILTPPKGTYSSTTGHIGVKVLDRDGKPAGGHTVTISGGPSGTRSGVSAPDGCVLFAFLLPGSYQVSVADTGYVDRAGNATPVQTATVQPALLWKGSFDYDRAATISATVQPPSGYALPQTLDFPVSLGNNGLALGSISRAGSGATRSLDALWPFASGYTLWAGDCLGNDPQYSGRTRAATVAVTPGATSSAVVDLGGLAVTVTSGGFPVVGATVLAVQAADSSCAAGQTITLGNTDGTGTVRAALPWGTWQLQVASRAPAGGTWPDTTLLRGDPPGTATVAVS